MRSNTILTSIVAGALLLGLAGCADSQATADPAPPSTGDAPSGDGAALGAEDGLSTDGALFTLDDDLPAIANLDPELREALDAASLAAAQDDVTFSFTDAWRSARYQQHLYDQALLQYGSEEEARRWVKPPDQSRHVSGQAVDVYSANAMDWLNRFGADYGLCQIYANEMWHFEYVEGVSEECPQQLPDSSAG